MVSLALPSFGVREAQNEESSLPPAQIRLTRKEAQLLALLQQNADRCLSRDFLLQTIWGYQAGTRTRTLDVHIQRLRRKLDPRSASHILTILRSGYIWSTDNKAG
jgi:two-component system alkaline phosphatase synthesis response regulator PhoP